MHLENWLPLEADIVLVILALIIFVWFISGREGFATREEKVNVIVNYFTDDKTPDYVDYKKTLEGQSDIVEYDAARKLNTLGRLTSANLERVI